MKYGRKLLGQFEKATGIKVAEEHALILDRVITTVIMYAEEQAEKLAKRLIAEGPRNGAEKRMLAENTARSLYPDVMAKVSPDEFAVMLESKLPPLRPYLPQKDPITGKSIPPRASSGSVPPTTYTSLPPLRMPSGILPDEKTPAKPSKRV